MLSTICEKRNAPWEKNVVSFFVQLWSGINILCAIGFDSSLPFYKYVVLSVEVSWEREQNRHLVFIINGSHAFLEVCLNNFTDNDCECESMLFIRASNWTSYWSCRTQTELIFWACPWSIWNIWSGFHQKFCWEVFQVRWNRSCCVRCGVKNHLSELHLVLLAIRTTSPRVINLSASNMTSSRLNKWSPSKFTTDINSESKQRIFIALVIHSTPV